MRSALTDCQREEEDASTGREASTRGFAISNHAVPTSAGGLSDSPLRRLRRENHLLRLQLLKLREQQRYLLDQAAAAGLSLSVGAAPPSLSPSSSHGMHRVPPRVEASGTTGEPILPTVPPCLDDEAAAMRARTLQRQEARQLRTTSARALLLPGVEESCAEERAAQPLPRLTSSSEVAPHTDTAFHLQAAHKTAELGEAATTVAAATTAPSREGAQRGGVPAEDDMSAQAMLQRFQNRKAQRRLRLEQMLGPGYDSGAADDAASETTPFGRLPRHAGGADEDGATSHHNSSSNSSVAAGGGGLDGGEAAPNEPLLHPSSNGGVAVGHRFLRAGESAASTGPPPIGPTQNPNQIGRVVTDAVRNNSWYLCKVLEAALLDTVQARHTAGDVTPARSPAQPLPSVASQQLTSTTPDGSAAGAAATPVSTPTTSFDARDGGGGGGAASQPFLYQVGVSDTALRRAIEESLVLPFRCVRDAPQRLTVQQAADENVPPFEAENRDAELRRCFGSHAGRHSAERGSSGGGAAQKGGGGSGGVDEDDSLNNGGGGTGVEAADEDNLDPFARLLLARISAELPANNAKGDKKHKDACGGGRGKQRDDGPQGSYFGATDGGTGLGKGVSASSASSAKINAAFVMAAAGGDGKVHIPKKHFSRLDEVQVEMHAPVIFNQIRGFLRLDIDRFRRSFLQAGDLGGDSAAPLRFSTPQQQQQQQQQQRRMRTNGGGAGGGGGVGGVAAGVEDATAWRISVSPGKSGTTLLYFGDYVMKTVRSSEMEFFTRKFLPAYVRYCERNPHTLLPRFYALVTVRWWKAGMAQHFVLMHNVFATPYYIHRIYDVKGSTVNRTALQPGKPPPRTAFGALLLKDNDLPPQLIICGAYQRAILLAQFRSDVGFLRQLSVVDYSCMIGVRSRLFSREEGPSKTIVLQRHQHHDNDAPYVDPLGGGEAPAPLTRHSRTHSEITSVTSAAADAGVQTVTVAVSGAGSVAVPSTASDGRAASEDDVYVCIHGCDGGLLSLPIYAPGDDTTAREDVYYLGIIDVLQTYNSAKKLESFAKGFVNDRQAISVIPPDGYSERLYKVLERITV